MLGWITEDQSQGQRGHLLYSLGLSGRAHGVSHHSYIKWCHNGVILHHNSSIEYFHSFYVPMTSCMHCYNQLPHVSTYFEIEWLGNSSHRLYKWNFLRFALTSIMYNLYLKSNIILLSHCINKVWNIFISYLCTYSINLFT